MESWPEAKLSVGEGKKFIFQGVTLFPFLHCTVVVKQRPMNALCFGPALFQEIWVETRGSGRSKEIKTREAYTGLLQASGKEEKWKTGVFNIVQLSKVHQRETEADVLVITRSACSWNILYAFVPPEASTGSHWMDQNSRIWHPSSAHQSSLPMATNSVLTSKLAKHAAVNSWQIIQQNSSIK